MLHMHKNSYEEILLMKDKMDKLAAQVAEQMAPAIKAARSMATSSGLQAAMRIAAEKAEIFSRIQKDHAEHWSHVLQLIDPEPAFVANLHNEVSIMESAAANGPENVSKARLEKEVKENKTIIDNAASEASNALEESVTRLQEEGLPVINLTLTANGYLKNEDVPGAQRKLSYQMRVLVSALKQSYVMTPVLTQKSMYKNDESTRRALHKLNRFGFSALKLPVAIALGEGGDGYRLTRCVRIKKQWSEPVG